MSDETPLSMEPKTGASARGDEEQRPAISRRDALQWVMAAVAAASAPEHLFAQATKPQDVRQHEAARQPNPKPGGYGVDPDLLKIYKPGVAWPLTFNKKQKRTAKTLADVILPKDHYGPAASEVGVVEMIDEWISAPYPSQQADRAVILDGLAWIESESQKRFGKPFAELSGDQHHAICDDICYIAAAKPQFREAARFFSRFRSIAAGAYYATPPGWEAIGYVGNVALPKFDGPPPEVLARLGVEQTVK